MKKQSLTLGILISIVFYSCSATSVVRRFYCKTASDIHGTYKLSPWKTIHFYTYMQHGYTARRGNIHVSHSKSVSCTVTFGTGTSKTMRKSCTNWAFARRKTLRYRIVCKDLSKDRR